MTHGKNIFMLTAMFTAVLYLTMPVIAMGQNDSIGGTQTDTMSKLKALPEQEKRIVLSFRFRDCCCPTLYEPDVEHVWLPQLYVKTPQLPWSVLQQYTHDMAADEIWRWPCVIEIEEVDGVKIIKKENDYE